MTDTSGPANPTPDGQAPAAPSLRVLGQYVKDLSFENPGHSPVQAQPNIDLGIDVGAAPHVDGNGLFEVSLKLSAKALSGETTLFITELDYAGLFQLSNVTEKQIEPMLLIECPRILFPFVRRIIADVTREGGFPPVTVDTVDFLALYRQELARRAQTQQTVPADKVN
jgi:preprotein translocase subunit SecB